MGKLGWYFNRLRAMSPREVVWRLEQKRLQRQELARFREKQAVTSPLYPGVEGLVDKVLAKPDSSRDTETVRAILRQTEEYGRNHGDESIRLLGGFRYEDYATDWHAGFNTSRKWPLEPSYCLEYKQRDDIGDARVNWELNRHRQFVRLAAAGNEGRLEALLDDWADKNPFLWGISWTSPMETAIRSISWMTAARLLMAREERNEELVRKLLTGAANMTEYLTRHESGFSSANNHLIVEVAAVTLAGFLFGNREWVGPSLDILDRELRHQVSADGVDLESSLHYHGFVLEAYLLVWRGMRENGMEITASWRDRLDEMARFVAASRVADGVWCVFGDDDEARISDPGFGDADYFDYLLDLYADLSGKDVRKDAPRWPARLTFPAGGYSFLRCGRMYAGIDHAPLGFGSIAAHGHNDILSFQLFLDGRPLLVDSGTYLYHTDRKRRDMLRSTRMHNTVTVNGQEQSQMLGAFLWGKKAESCLLSAEDDGLSASVKGLSGVTHTRNWKISAGETETLLEVTDSFDRDCRWEATLIVVPGLSVVKTGERSVEIGGKLRVDSSTGEISTDVTEIATEYGRLTETTAIRIVGNSRENCLTLQSL